MALAAGIEGQQQESRLPTPALAPAEPAGLQYERLDASDAAADQEELSRSDAAGSGQSICSEDSWTTDDEASAGVNGNQMWSMSFEWQDGHAEDPSEALAQFEKTTDFSERPFDSTSEQSSSTDSRSACCNDDAEPSPADADWVQPWNQTDTAMTASSCHIQNENASAHASSTKQKPKSQPMSEEHKTAILGAMKNVKIDYVPRWAMYVEETRWLNSIKAKAAKESQSK